jgi:hypothetical protein
MAERRLKLEPTLYQLALVDYLRAEERELWAWFSSDEAQSQYVEAMRTALRKSAHRLEADAHADLMPVAEEAKAGLGLNLPLTLYKTQQPQPGQLNATLYYIPGEAHIVLSGPLLSLLTPVEMKAIIGHELAHYLLWERDGGEFLVADRILQAMTDDRRSTPSHHQSARRYRLYTEIFADRGSLVAAKDLHTAVAGLAKVETGSRQVNAGVYLKRAEKVFSHSKAKTGRLSHPEVVIRARALRLWADQADDLDAQLAAMIEGPDAMADLDLLGQARYTRLTRRLLEQLLRPKWFQTEAMLAHAKLFFPDYKPAVGDDPSLVEALTVEDPRLREYVAYILLDFAVADPGLADLSLAAVWEWGRKLNMDSEFETLLAKELKLKPRDLKLLKHEAKERLKHAEKSAAAHGAGAK